MNLPRIILAALALSAGFAAAQNSVIFEWDKNPEPDILGYRLYQKVTTAPVPPATEPVVAWKLVGTVDSTLNNIRIQKVPFGVNVYAVAAYNSFGEGAKSNEVINSIIRQVGKARVVKIETAP